MKKLNEIDRNSDMVVIGRAELFAVYDLGICTPALTGGVVRDQLHGLVPRDIDLAVVDLDPDLVGEVLDALGELGWETHQHFDRDEENNYADQFPGEEDRFDHIFKMRRLGDGNKVEHLDLLVYAAQIDTIQQMIDSHDHNVSQFAAWIDPASQLVADYRGDRSTFGVAHQIRPNVNAARIERVKEIALALGWGWACSNFAPLPEPIPAAGSYPTVPQEWLDDL